MNDKNKKEHHILQKFAWAASVLIVVYASFELSCKYQFLICKPPPPNWPLSLDAQRDGNYSYKVTQQLPNVPDVAFMTAKRPQRYAKNINAVALQLGVSTHTLQWWGEDGCPCRSWHKLHGVYDLAAIRRWAAGNGYDVDSDTGRIE